MITFDIMKRIKIMITIAIIFLALILLVFYLRGIRKHFIFYCSQTLFSGEKIELKFDNNYRKIWYSFPERHAIISIGGGDGRNDIYFVYKGQNYHLRTYYTPMLINDFEGKLFLIIEGYDSNVEQIQFQFFRFDNEWKRIKPEEFPKSIAIPNIYCVRLYLVDNEIRKLEALNPDLKNFRNSMTATIWFCLEKGIEYYKDKVDKNFLIEYKKKYIAPYWDDKKLIENVPVIVPVARQYKK